MLLHCRFNDDEVNALSQVITLRPPATQSGVRFVSLALSMLIACPSLVSTTALENKAIEWLQWLIKEEAFFGISSSDATTSLGEMLLLLAIHFHSNQITAIGDLVCATLAMKIPIRPNSTNRIKQVFTQELFTEQVVASHAVRVPVTPNLNANISGYLPVHCIHQLLKSRAFLKHKVPIKLWIYKQICSSVRPLHPVVPTLIEVYVNSLIVPNPQGKVNIDHMHKPFAESEIMHIFKASQALLLFGNKNYVGEFASNSAALTENEETASVEVRCATTAQLLILYYLVLYEETRLSHLNSTALAGRKLKQYSNNFLSELPMKYLLQKAEQHHNDYVGLFHPLLRLIITNYPHLSMVEDWLEQHCTVAESEMARPLMSAPKIPRSLVVKALQRLCTKPETPIKVFKSLLKLPPEDLVPYADLVVENIAKVFDKDVPRVIKDLYKDIWLRLNAVLPISFWKMSLNAIISSNEGFNRCIYVNEDLLDPLQVLR